MRNRIKELRETRGLTQRQLGDQLDVSRQTINYLETGRYDPSLTLAFRIAHLFKLPIEEVFTNEPDRESADAG